MADTFISCLKILKNYTGMKLLFALTVLAWVYLLFVEKNRTKKIILVFMPLVMVLLFICPLTYMAFEATGLDVDTYYRLLWMIPMGIITVYGVLYACHKNPRYRLLGTLVTTILFMVFGKCIYTSDSFFKSENIYGLPQQTIDIVDYIRSHDTHSRLTVLPSADLITTIRQYDANICMPYGRDMFNPNLDFSNPVYDAFEGVDRIDVPSLLEATREYEVEYIIIHAATLVDGDPTDFGLELLGNVDDHLIYRDPVMAERIEEMEKYYK